MGKRREQKRVEEIGKDMEGKGLIKILSAMQHGTLTIARRGAIVSRSTTAPGPPWCNSNPLHSPTPLHTEKRLNSSRSVSKWTGAKLLRHIRSELHAYATLTGTTAGCGLGICPEHLHHESRLARLPLTMSVQLPDVV